MLRLVAGRSCSPWQVLGGRGLAPIALGPLLAQHSAEGMVGGLKCLEDVNENYCLPYQ